MFVFSVESFQKEQNLKQIVDKSEEKILENN